MVKDHQYTFHLFPLAARTWLYIKLNRVHPSVCIIKKSWSLNQTFASISDVVVPRSIGNIVSTSEPLKKLFALWLAGRKSWNEANSLCQEFGATLPTVSRFVNIIVF